MTTIIELQPDDDLNTLRDRLSRVEGGRAILVLPWDLHVLQRPLDFDLLRRTVDRYLLNVALVSPDPAQRELARSSGWPVYASVERADQAAAWRQRGGDPLEPPPRHWWDEPVNLRPRRVRKAPRWLRWAGAGTQTLIFGSVFAVLLATAYAVVPGAEITLTPAGQTVSAIVPVAVDPDVEAVDPEAGIVPGRWLGVYVESAAETPATGTADVTTEKATGQVLFSNTWAQDFMVVDGTVVRTSASGYPVRFETTADVIVPPLGQASVPIQALEAGAQGEVGAFQINQVEGVAALVVRVTNPAATRASAPQQVHVVTQADYDRLRETLIQQLLVDAFVAMHDLLEPNEILPHQALIVQAVPKEAYTRFIGEQAESVGLQMRLLISGVAVDRDNAEVIAYRKIASRLPEGYRLIDAQFEFGEVSEEDIGPGYFTIFVTGTGYAAAELDLAQARSLVRGQPLDGLAQELADELPLAASPIITVWPEWMDRAPLLTARIHAAIVPQEGDLAAGD